MEVHNHDEGATSGDNDTPAGELTAVYIVTILASYNMHHACGLHNTTFQV